MAFSASTFTLLSIYMSNNLSGSGISSSIAPAHGSVLVIVLRLGKRETPVGLGKEVIGVLRLQ